MAYEVKFSKKAAKAYKKLPADIRLRIDHKINYLRNTPRGTDTKKLAGHESAYRTRRLSENREPTVEKLNLARISDFFR